MSKQTKSRREPHWWGHDNEKELDLSPLHMEVDFSRYHPNNLSVEVFYDTPWAMAFMVKLTPEDAKWLIKKLTEKLKERDDWCEWAERQNKALLTK